MKEIVIALIACGALVLCVGIAAEAYTEARKKYSDNWLQAQREELAARSKANRQLSDVLRDMGILPDKDD